MYRQSTFISIKIFDLIIDFIRRQVKTIYVPQGVRCTGQHAAVEHRGGPQDQRQGPGPGLKVGRRLKGIVSRGSRAIFRLYPFK